ncbi:MAG TPA: hypothetical protein P5056_01855 [Candidatus Paceibacterota bacterium]|nr:hypothetical protein [Candidatus Paceibacterota bacterium]
MFNFWKRNPEKELPKKAEEAATKRERRDRLDRASRIVHFPPEVPGVGKTVQVAHYDEYDDIIVLEGTIMSRNRDFEYIDDDPTPKMSKSIVVTLSYFSESEDQQEQGFLDLFFDTETSEWSLTNDEEAIMTILD